ncbi:MAG: heat-shock protein Hsp20 [Rickettsiales bacterium]|jgi:HSP20 family protein|nr:heat-shock protein Hsp20 [Rickettsiales bacterium]
MKIQKFNPWNWFAREEGDNNLFNKSQLQQDIANLYDELNHIAERMFRGDSPPLLPELTQGVFKPKMDIIENDDSYSVTLEIPGMKEEDIHIEISDHILSIHGEKKQESEEKSEGLYRSERSYGQFHRILSLPEDTETDKVEATYKKGLAKITLPRKTTSKKKPKEIKFKKSA